MGPYKVTLFDKEKNVFQNITIENMTPDICIPDSIKPHPFPNHPGHPRIEIRRFVLTRPYIYVEV